MMVIVAVFGICVSRHSNRLVCIDILDLIHEIITGVLQKRQTRLRKAVQSTKELDQNQDQG
jgi:hypothetical protein